MKILIVKPSSLGDIIHALPFLSAVRELHPQAEISWVVNPVYKDLVAYNPHIAKVMLFDRNIWKKSYIGGYKNFYNLVKDMQLEKFDMAIDLQGLMRSALITFYSGAKEKMVVNNTREGAKFFYRKFLGSDEKDMHAVDRIMSVAADLGWKKRPLTSDDFSIFVPDEITKKVSSFLDDKSKRLVVVNPFTRWESKKWSQESYVLLINKLLERGFSVAVTGAASDKEEGRYIVDKVNDERLINLIGKTSLIELVALLKKAVFMISSDSGPVHLANALGCRTVTLFGPTSPVRTAAYLEGNHVLSSEAKCSPCLKKMCPLSENKNHCMNDIAVDDILKNLN